MKNIALALLVFAVGTSAFAEMIPTCTSIKPKSASIGAKCATSRGAVYERVSRDKFGEAWKGPDGLIWSAQIGEYLQYTQSDAISMCKNLGANLPADDDFKQGEKNGFREVLTDLKYNMFWSSTANPTDSRVADCFSGDDGHFYPTLLNNGDSVRCIAR